jgi:HAD superfamily hydrolase (TIGR01490 family)
MTVAAFDLDGTLTRHDCVRPFLVSLGGWHGIAAAIVRRSLETAAAVARWDRDMFKEIVVGGVFRGRSVADVAALGERFAERIERHSMRSDTVARLRWHQREGHATVIVSASLGPYLRPLARRLGTDGVLCTDVVDDGETYGDALRGGNCRAGEKARRLARWIATSSLDGAELWAYGDSRGDREMLSMAARPVWVTDGELAEVPG